MGIDVITRLQKLGIYEHVLNLKKKLGEQEGGDTLLPMLPCKDNALLSPENKELEGNYIYVYPTTVEEVKRLAGVEASVAEANKERRDAAQLSRMTSNKPLDIGRLAYFYLILSETEIEEMLTASPYTVEDVKDYILQKSRVLPVLCAGGTLEVMDGETYRIEKTAVAVFDTVIFHGRGSIMADTNTKISILKQVHIQ